MRHGSRIRLAAALLFVASWAAPASAEYVIKPGSVSGRVATITSPSAITVSSPEGIALYSDRLPTTGQPRFGAYRATDTSEDFPVEPNARPFEFSAGPTPLVPGGSGAVLSRCSAPSECRLSVAQIQVPEPPFERPLPIEDGPSLTKPAIWGYHVAYVTSIGEADVVRVHDARSGAIRTASAGPSGRRGRQAISVAVRGDLLASLWRWTARGEPEYGLFLTNLKTGRVRRVFAARGRRQSLFSSHFSQGYLYFAQAGRERSTLYRYAPRGRLLSKAMAPAPLASFAVGRLVENSLNAYYVTAGRGQGDTASCPAPARCGIYRFGGLPRFRPAR